MAKHRVELATTRRMYSYVEVDAETPEAAKAGALAARLEEHKKGVYCEWDEGDLDEDGVHVPEDAEVEEVEL